MLGKGLESLIPQKGSNNANSNAAVDPADLLPSGNNGRGVPDLNPRDELSAEPVKQELPSERPVMFEVESNPPSTPVQQLSPAPYNAPVAQPTTKMADANPRPQETKQSQQSSVQSSQAKSPAQKKDENALQLIYQIEVEKVEPNPGQPRRVFDETALHDLARSIREFGFLQPIVVTKVEKESPNGIDVSYELIAGERRLMAAKLLGLRIVPAIIRNVNLEREKVELAVIENIQRENLNPIETARAFQRLQEEFRMTQREIAAKLGKSREVVANTVRLLDLPEYIQEGLGRGELSESHARALLAIEDPGAQKKLFDEILTSHMTTRDLKDRVNQIVAKRPYHRADQNLLPEVKALQETVSMSLGAPIEIHRTANTGKIMITFYSEEELENILRKIGKEEG